MVTTYDYNYANLPVSLVNKRGNDTLSAFTCHYYLDGNRRSKKAEVHGRATKTTGYIYDSMGRLSSEEQAGSFKHVYTYDRFSNRSTMTVTEPGKQQAVTAYEYDLRNLLHTETKQQGETTEIYYYAYDYNGNLRRREWERFRPADPSKAGVVGFTRPDSNNGIVLLDLREHNGFNELTRLMRDTRVTTYRYRPDGLRHQKSSDNETNHIWDGQNLVAEYGGDGSMKAQYLRGIGLIAQQIDLNLFFYCFNAHGDVVQRTNASGSVLNTYEYDAFGNEVEPDALNVNPFHYCGEYFDTESGSYYLRARYYAPRIGRFTKIL